MICNLRCHRTLKRALWHFCRPAVPALPAARPSVPKYSAEKKHSAYLIMVRSELAAGAPRSSTLLCCVLIEIGSMRKETREANWRPALPAARASVPKYSAEKKHSAYLIMVRSELAAGAPRGSTLLCCVLNKIGSMQQETREAKMEAGTAGCTPKRAKIFG